MARHVATCIHLFTHGLFNDAISTGYLSLHRKGLRGGRPRFDSRQRQEIFTFLYSEAFTLVLGPTQSPMQMGTGGPFLDDEVPEA
jgi:hypothetical protein